MQTFANTYRCTDSPNANASTISPTLRLRFGSKLSCYKSQAGEVTMATSSKIPVAHGVQKGSFTPLTFLCQLPSLRCQWSGIPDTDRDTFSDAPQDHRGPWAALPSLCPSVPPQLTAFHPPSLLKGFPFPLAFNGTTPINSVNGPSTP